MKVKRLNIILPMLFALFLVGGMLIGNRLNRISEYNNFQVYPRLITSLLNMLIPLTRMA